MSIAGASIISVISLKNGYNAAFGRLLIVSALILLTDRKDKMFIDEAKIRVKAGEDG